MGAAIEYGDELSDRPPTRSGVLPCSADDLIARVAAGDADAFARFYDLLAERMFGVVRRVVRDAARSEEVVQDVMLELWRAAPSCDPSRRTAAGWAVSIAHRRAVDCVRREVAQRRRDYRYVDNCTLAAPCQPEPCAIAVRGDIGTQVRRALLCLPETQRSPIELAYFGGLTHAAIATELQLPLGTVKSRVRGGLVRLQDELAGCSNG